MSDWSECGKCGRQILQQPEKALADGEIQIVWKDEDGAWVCKADGEEHLPGDFVLDPVEAISYGIFAINTLMSPDASSVEDFERLEQNAERATKVLADLREWVIAQGEDLRL